jgi:thymidylate kinase
VGWALLRGAGTGGEGDIDLLIHPGDAARARAALRDAGFPEWPAIGHGGHRFHRAYDDGADRWLAIDVVTELAFGVGSSLVLDGAAEAVLERRDASRRPPRLAPDDAFWSLLLHDLLDRRGIPDHHAAELAGLVGAATPDGDLGRRLDALAGPGRAVRLIALVAGDDRDAALIEGGRMGRRWARRTMPAAAIRRVRHMLLRRLRKPFTAIRRRGIDVTVLGPDGAGKSTVARSLGAMTAIPTRTIYLGLYGSGLDGTRRFGLARRLGRVWRGWLAGRWHRLRGRLVVYDRHALDARMGRPGRTTKARLRRWILGHAIPEPDLVLILDAPAEVLFARKGEHDIASLADQRRRYLELAASLRHARVVDVDRDADAVRRDVTGRIWRRMTLGRDD